jgi:hypothetical protein
MELQIFNLFPKNELLAESTELISNFNFNFRTETLNTLANNIAVKT